MGLLVSLLLRNCSVTGFLCRSSENVLEILELVVELRSATASRIEQALVTQGGRSEKATGGAFFWWKFWMSSSNSEV